MGEPSARITDRDLKLLAFMAEHRLILADHMRALLGVSRSVAHRRLHALSELGMVGQQRLFHAQPGAYRITRRGLAAIDSSLPPPRVDWRSYAHDLGLAWLWLAAQRGELGELKDVISERRLRSHDGTARGGEDVLGVRLGGYGPNGKPRLHYPDLVLIDPSGRRIAVELELSCKGRTRRERILGGYASDPRIDAVLYLADKPHVARAIRDSARRLDASARIYVRPVRWADGRAPDAAGRGLDRRRGSKPGRGERSGTARPATEAERG